VLKISSWGKDILVAFQFLTRLPLPPLAFDADSLPRAIKFFPLVGFGIGFGAAMLEKILTAHLSRPMIALVLLVYSVLITGGLHEDGLADAADGFGGGCNKSQILLILRDSRIGSYGAIALVFSLIARYILLTSLPQEHFAAYLISAHVLCRWSALPLSYFLPAARENDGQGARIAQLTSLGSMIGGTIFSIVVVGFALQRAALAPVLTTTFAIVLSGWFYSRKIDGVTGDCFGATNQLSEIAVYFCGVWNS
jgi:adenosylcobinamide-GDP ribazoletransferase